MSTFWFVSAPLVSHTDWGGFLCTAQALQVQGHQIVWISEKELGDWIGRARLPFVPVQETGWLWPPPPPPDFTVMPPHEAMNLRYTRAIDTWLTVDRVANGTRALLDLADRKGRPDVIVSDPFLSASALAAEALDVPLGICGWPAQSNLDEENLFPIQRALGSDSHNRIAELCELFDLEAVNFSDGPTPSIVSPHLHICYFTEGWYRAEQISLLPQNQFVGGIATVPDNEPPGWLQDIPGEWGLGLVTLGTTFTGDLGFFSWAAHAVAREGLIPVVAIGWNPVTDEAKRDLIRSLPGGSRLLNWVPFGHVLPRTRVMIHHGGMGTTHHAVVHGVPQIVVPHAADQRVQAKRVAQAKVGLHLTAHDVRQGKLSEAARAILNEERVVQTANGLAARMASLGGAARAADYLVRLAEDFVPLHQ